MCEEVQVGKDQEKVQSEENSHYKNRDRKKINQQSGTYTMKTHSKLSYLFLKNLTKGLKTHIRRQQHKTFKHQDIKRKKEQF